VVISNFDRARKWRRAKPASTAPVFVATAVSACADGEDEIDMLLLDTVTLPGSRFDRMIKKLLTA
jgi:hypothetical protein